MRRILPTALTLALLLSGVAQAAPVPAGEAPSLGARVDACEAGATSDQRVAEFTGSMPAGGGSSVLSMRFELEQRRGSTWKVVGVPSFKARQRSTRGAAGFVYSKRVERLDAGSSYRVKVSFRWTDAAGEVVRSAVRRSRICRQPDLRPGLSVVDVLAGPGADGMARYAVQVRNDGPGAVLVPVAVRLAVEGAAATEQRLGALSARTTVTLQLDGPACVPGGTVRVEADPADEVEEGDEADNAFVLRCP